MKTRTKLSLILPILASVWFASGCGPRTEQEIFDAATGAQKNELFDEATELFERLLVEFPDSPRKPEVLYALGVLYQDRSKDFAKALTMYRRIETEFPDHATASNATFMIGFIEHNEMKNIDSARTAYERFIARYPESPLAESARFELANLGKDPAELLSSEK